jgi:L-seryl-tRNA(Ser) seleniumtransferase
MNDELKVNLRDLPSVDEMLRADVAEGWIARFGRPLTLEAVREALEEVRSRAGDLDSLPDRDALFRWVDQLLSGWTAPTLVSVINASGVIVHTNLGRAPLSPAAIQSMQAVSEGYSNLEYDLGQGVRGSRLIHAEELLRKLTGAQAALVVNNNAAALLLILTALARRKRVVISRTQLIEIGGGFRIPDVMKQSGARLVEVGTTNRVHLYDYEGALEFPVALFLRAHRSNFRLVGFTSEPSLEDLADLARRAEVPFVDDLGSGTLLATEAYGLGHEPMVQESLEAGADLVSFSGDKLLGGPQAGVIVGREDLIARLKVHPLARAVRADKLCLAGLTATLQHYLKDEAVRKIPVWRMIATPLQDLEARAVRWSGELGQGEVTPGESTVGGGSLPGETLPTRLLALPVSNPNRILGKMRRADPPIIGRVEDDHVALDPRTVLPEQDDALLRGVRQALGS